MVNVEEVEEWKRRTEAAESALIIERSRRASVEQNIDAIAKDNETKRAWRIRAQEAEAALEELAAACQVMIDSDWHPEYRADVELALSRARAVAESAARWSDE